jgi:hypothetical protein
VLLIIIQWSPATRKLKSSSPSDGAKSPRWFVTSQSLYRSQLVSFHHRIRNFILTCLGPYGCVGKQLALMELRSVIARIVTEFDVSFAPGEDGTALLEESLDTFTIALAPLMLVFKKSEV